MVSRVGGKALAFSWWREVMAKQVYARPALLITHTRSGGTMLNYGLSTHRRIFWTRGEPLLQQMEWGKAFPDATDLGILDCITRASFYTVAGCKITYEQMTPAIWDWVQRKRPNIKILHLVRENLIRVAISQMITGLAVSQQLKGHRAHSFDVLGAVRITVCPDTIIGRAVRQGRAIENVRKRIAQIDPQCLELTYKEITGGQIEADHIPADVGSKICEFLGVRYETLSCDLRRVNRAPLSEIIENWPEFKRAVEATKFKHFLEEE